MLEGEPIIHSEITDCLDEDHPLAYETVMCAMKREHGCWRHLHAANNECMTAWVEFANLAVCARAFAHFILSGEDFSYDKFTAFVMRE